MPRAIAGVLSPCNQICLMDPASGCCRGCGRTLGEISGWLFMTDDERHLTLERCQERPWPGPSH
jgi:predicted Fe-S protein YdhL (DUF1289 family)